MVVLSCTKNIQSVIFHDTVTLQEEKAFKLHSDHTKHKSTSEIMSAHARVGEG